MYKLLLILKYLRKRRIAWVSLVAVMLCTTMIIVVLSVMSGWLSAFKETAHGLAGDIIVARRSWSGFPYYQEMIDEMMKRPDVQAVVPTLQTAGLININNQIRTYVQVIGYPIDQVGKVNKFPLSLYRQHLAADDPSLSKRDHQAAVAQARQPPSFALPLPPDEYRAMRPKAKGDVTQWPGMIVGDGVVGFHLLPDGTVSRDVDALLSNSARLTVMGMDENAVSVEDTLNSRTVRDYWLVDDSRTNFYQQDENTVYVSFVQLQQDLRMDADTYTDADTGKQVTKPARTSNLQIAVKPGVNPDDVVKPLQVIVNEVLDRHQVNFPRDTVVAQTWEQQQVHYINAIEHEVVLMMVLFGIMCIVAVFLIFCIFYMIVAEKTRDIGIIKSVGATSGGVAAIFLGYGLAIGIVGGGLGLLVGYLIVHYINQIHAWIGAHLGLVMWDPSTYQFDHIPNRLDAKNVTIIVIAAVISSIIGSLIPAIRAARMNPVEALRWE